MEKNDDKDPDDHHDDLKDKSSGEEKSDVVSDAHPPDDADVISKDYVDETDHGPGDNVDKVDSPSGQETPEVPQTLESLKSTKTTTPRRKKGDQEDDDYFQIPQFVGKFLDLFEDKLSKHDSGEPKTTWYQDPEEVSSLLDAVDRVSNLMKLLLNTKSCLDHHEPLINHAGSIQQRAMAFLEDEFRILLEESVIKEAAVVTDYNSSQRKSSADQQDHHNDTVVSQDQDQMVVPEHGDQEIEYPGYSEDVVALLRKIAEKMKAGGYGWECREVYLVGRRNILMRTLKHDCEFEKVSIDEVQKMSWGELERDPYLDQDFQELLFPLLPWRAQTRGEDLPGGRRELVLHRGARSHHPVLGVRRGRGHDQAFN
ncbi:hypothetical protein Bca52824_096213 [Brassica carinata]|uniref:Uncharacterized protein n=1 Tax=Brassica carinata TaxID=52824 RepID=A0A8X7NYX3_BRACI|nr:hypothetical protein Bca52824_096213 [Brassica carinata]